VLVSVALPLPLFAPLTYAVPDALKDRVAPGSRVVVPLRGKRELGFVVGPAAARDAGKTKDILDAPDAAPVVDTAMLALCTWIADYYLAPIGVVLRAALPLSLTGASRPTPTPNTARHVEITKTMMSLLERDAAFKRAPKQREVYELVESLGGSAAVDLLVERMSFTPATLKAMSDRGLIAIRKDVVQRDPFAARPTSQAQTHEPTPAQKSAIVALRTAAPGHTFLLHGVTGSGKTLVYLELLREVVNVRKKSAIVLVPEIALTPQTVDRFRAVFGDSVAVLHSTLSDGERYDAWCALQRGERRIAVGARSAIFAPLADLGAIIVDEEHESSYKQNESPRYHAREVAIVRAREQGAVVVLGSATPSLESWANAASGKYTLLSLPERVGGGQLPAVRVVDMRVKAATAPPTTPTAASKVTAAVRFALSEQLEDALRDRLTRKEQSILLLNRRGYASFVQCAQCGEVEACPNCSISLTLHRAPERLVCHYCRHTAELRAACAQCGGAFLRQRGLGTQQVEKILTERVPGARITRMDMDTTGGKWAHANILDRVGRGEVDILLGTQMIAKGLDFPNVTLVGVIDADVGVNLPDFRASERCFQLLSQVAGRAGRGPKGGEVIIQTRVPGHHAVKCAMTHDYVAFVKQETASRVDPRYPPTLRLLNVVFSGTNEGETVKFAMAAADRLSAHLEADARVAAEVMVVGPAPCPIDRIKNRWRWHLLLKSEHAGRLTQVARYFAERLKVPSRGGLRVIVDRDPVSLL
jgi:primosomal protein N' (replication factor Y)